jgi:hypothetical protein
LEPIAALNAQHIDLNTPAPEPPVDANAPALDALLGSQSSGDVAPEVPNVQIPPLPETPDPVVPESALAPAPPSPEPPPVMPPVDLNVDPAPAVSTNTSIDENTGEIKFPENLVPSTPPEQVDNTAASVDNPAAPPEVPPPLLPPDDEPQEENPPQAA